MATGTNAIATELEAKNKINSYNTLEASSTKCCTKKLAKLYGAFGLDSYPDTKLVKYSEIWARCSEYTYENMPLIAVFKDNYYCDVNSYYLIVTVTITDGINTYTKETRVDAYLSGVSNLVYNLPNGYVGIATTQVGNNVNSNVVHFDVAPHGLLEYPCGNGAPEKVTTTISVALYTTGTPGDSSQAMSSDYGSGGGVFLKMMDETIFEKWYYSQTSALVDWYYESTFRYSNPGVSAVEYWYPTGSDECIVCYDSNSTRTATLNYIF